MMTNNRFIATILVVLLCLVGTVVSGCSRNNVELFEESYGVTPEGISITEYTIRNNNGIEVSIINYGGIITSLLVPDKEGNFDDVVLGYDNLKGYIDDGNYFGALIGRYANRIDEGVFKLDGKTYQLETNNGKNHLHGGSDGFHKKIWDAEPFITNESAGVTLSLASPDGEGGFPGNLIVQATYELNSNDELSLTFSAKTDKPTPVNLTNHSYFNLKGEGPITEHTLTINADSYTPVDSSLIPTGDILPVKDTPMDFTLPKPIGKDIFKDYEQLSFGKGYDHNWVISDRNSNELKEVAVLSEPSSGRVLKLFSDSPGLQFYSGNFLDGSTIGKGGQVYNFRTGLCLEPQFFPDSPNQDSFPSATLLPGDTYTHRIVYKFSTL